MSYSSTPQQTTAPLPPPQQYGAPPPPYYGVPHVPWVPPYPLATLADRILALIIDYIILAIPIALIFVLFIVLTAITFGIIGVIITFGVMIIFYLLYFPFCEAFWDGATIGKKFMHIKVVMEDGRPMDFVTAFIRNILRIIDGLPGGIYILGIIFIAAVWKEKQQRLGDYLAHTIVVKAGVAPIPHHYPQPQYPQAQAPPPVQPPAYTGCPYCRAQIPTVSLTCPHCGARVR